MKTKGKNDIKKLTEARGQEKVLLHEKMMGRVYLFDDIAYDEYSCPYYKER